MDLAFTALGNTLGASVLCAIAVFWLAIYAHRSTTCVAILTGICFAYGVVAYDSLLAVRLVQTGQLAFPGFAGLVVPLCIMGLMAVIVPLGAAFAWSAAHEPATRRHLKPQGGQN